MEGKVLLIGLGLIGGSIALALKKEHPKSTIIGCDINLEQAKLAQTLQIVDDITVTIEEHAQTSDLIIISAPVQQTEIIIEQLAQCNLKKDVIITDVGSTKQRIVEKAKSLLNNGYSFIGGHPMAGSHKSGVAAAKVHLFENAFYIFTPTAEEASANKLSVLKNWLKGTKANFITMSAKEHDRLAGVISHFPHIIAASLVHQAEQLQHENALVSRLAAGGFRDITRIASSNPAMWRDILLHNKGELLTLFESWIVEMEKVRSLIVASDSSKIYDYFNNAKDFRDALPTRVKGAIPSFYDLYVDVPDYPGIISEITGYLAKERISITNIRIIETREEIYGVLRLSFQSENDRERAKSCIEKETNFDTYYG